MRSSKSGDIDNHRPMEKFPRDINFNIFSRLPLKSVIQSSAVSKLWLDVIKDRSFVKLYTSLANPDASQMIMTRRTYGEENIISLTPLKYEGNLLITDRTPIDHIVSALSWVFIGTCNGLLCFTSLDKEEEEITMICNPVTRGHIFLPRPSIRIHKYTPTLAFGFDIMSKSYKVVRILLPYIATDEWIHRRYSGMAGESCRHVKTEVFTLGENSSWREIQVENYLPFGDPVYVNGCVYWSAGNLDYKILSFDLGTENFKLIPSPSFGSISSVRELRGYLYVIDLLDDFVNIWVLKDDKNYSWGFSHKIPTHKSSIPNNRAYYRPGNMSKPMLIDVHELDGSVVVWLNNELFAYDKRTFSSRVIKLKGFPVWLDWEIHSGYRGSLVTLENLGAVSEEQKGMVRFVSEDEMTCHLLAKGSDFRAQKEPNGECAVLVAGFKKHGMFF